MLTLNPVFIDEQLTKLVERVEEALDTTDILDEVGALMLTRTRTRFLREVDPDEIPWKPSQAAIRRRRLGGTGTLFNTGKLWRSIQLADRGPNQRAIMTDVPYGVTHQEGLQGNVKRVFLGFGEQDERLVDALLEKRLNEALP